MMKLRGESLHLRIFPDEALRQPCEPVERFDAELCDLIDEMFILMRVREGIGLAALGWDYKACLFAGSKIDRSALSTQA